MSLSVEEQGKQGKVLLYHAVYQQMQLELCLAYRCTDAMAVRALVDGYDRYKTLKAKFEAVKADQTSGRPLLPSDFVDDPIRCKCGKRLSVLPSDDPNACVLVLVCCWRRLHSHCWEEWRDALVKQSRDLYKDEINKKSAKVETDCKCGESIVDGAHGKAVHAHLEYTEFLIERRLVKFQEAVNEENPGLSSKIHPIDSDGKWNFRLPSNRPFYEKN